MYLDSTQKLTLMQQKIRSVENHLQQSTVSTSASTTIAAISANASNIVEDEISVTITENDAQSCTLSDASSLASYSSKTDLLKRINQRLKQKSGLLKEIVYRQTFYAYCLKLLMLFTIALVHVFYIRPFLDTFSLLEDYSSKVDAKFSAEMDVASKNVGSASSLASLSEAKVTLQREVDVLNHYKKNVWMTVAAMCVALSTSCFFLFILPITRSVRRFNLYLIGVVDLVSFATLPLLLLARAELVTRITEGLPESMRVAHRSVSAERLMNALQCTIHPREKLAFCSDVLMDSVFPVILLKYLVILCVLTSVYILLAYVIDYCLKHWFPPHHSPLLPYNNHSITGSLLCTPDCEDSTRNKSSHWNDNFNYYTGEFNSPSDKSAKLKNKTYLPALLVPMNKCSGKQIENGEKIRPQMPSLLPNPLAGQFSPITKSTTLTATVKAALLTSQQEGQCGILKEEQNANKHCSNSFTSTETMPKSTNLINEPIDPK